MAATSFFSDCETTTGAFWARSIDGAGYLLGDLALRQFGTYWGESLLRTKSSLSCHVVSGVSASIADRLLTVCDPGRR